MATYTPQHMKLDELFKSMQHLTQTSSLEDFTLFGAFFDENCVVHLQSMREYYMPAIGRRAAIFEMQERLKTVRILERQILARSSTADGNTIFCETKQRLEVCGEDVDPFFETVLVKFNNEGLIHDLNFIAVAAQSSR
jgi:hypothetical protein